MKNSVGSVLAIGLLLSASALADDKMGPMGQMGPMAGMDHHKMMDTNGDGMISKDEFMKHHEQMWERMKKNSDGMVDVKTMPMMGGGMMGGEKKCGPGMKGEMP